MYFLCGGKWSNFDFRALRTYVRNKSNVTLMNCYMCALDIMPKNFRSEEKNHISLLYELINWNKFFIMDQYYWILQIGY